MAEKKTVLVTGVAGYWGSRVATRLVAEAGRNVIGLDAEGPAEDIEGLDLIQADIGNPLLVDLLKAVGVDVVCHLAFVEALRRHEETFTLNVMGTMRLLSACAGAAVEKVVHKSSMAVYGARATNSAFLAESSMLRGNSRYGYMRDLVEIEALCDGFRQQEPDVMLTVLRFSSIVGPTADTSMTRFLREPLAPSPLGFDPMMQIIHEDDVVEALVHAVLTDVPGVFNVATEGVLPLSRIRGLAGKPLIPVLHPVAGWGAELLGGMIPQLGRYMPIEPDYLCYPWVGDLTRMRQEFGYQPLKTAEETLREFAQHSRLGHYRSTAARMARAEQRLRDIIEQRRRACERQAPSASGMEEGVTDE